MESFRGTRVDGYFITEVGLIFLCVKWSYLPSVFAKARTPLFGDYCGTLERSLGDGEKRRNPIGLFPLAVKHLACRAERMHLGWSLKSVAYLLFFLVSIKIQVLPLLSWKMLLLRDLWRFSLNLQNKSAHWIYCMSRFIYIHPKGADIKNELHKKIIFRDNSRPCSPVITS